MCYEKILSDELILSKIRLFYKNDSSISGLLNEDISMMDRDGKRDYFVKILHNISIKYEKGEYEVIKAFSNIEKYLFFNKSYRDHVLHLFRVWGLGILLYNENIIKRQFKEKEIIKDNFAFQWYLAASYHDIGYPIKEFNKIFQDFKDYFDNMGLGSIVNYHENVFDQGIHSREIDNKLVELGLQKLINPSITEEKHGIISSRMLLYFIMKQLNNRYSPQVEKSLKSIAFHDYSEIQVDFNSDPLSALLIISDELQDWDRIQEENQQNNYFDAVVSISEVKPFINPNHFQNIKYRLKIQNKPNSSEQNIIDRINDTFANRLKSISVQLELSLK